MVVVCWVSVMSVNGMCVVCRCGLSVVSDGLGMLFVVK